MGAVLKYRQLVAIADPDVPGTIRGHIGEELRGHRLRYPLQDSALVEDVTLRPEGMQAMQGRQQQVMVRALGDPADDPALRHAFRVDMGVDDAVHQVQFVEAMHGTYPYLTAAVHEQG